MPDVAKVVCLVRASDDTTAKARLGGVLKDRQLSCDSQKVEVWASDLVASDLGLGKERYDELLSTVDAVIHVSPALVRSQETPPLTI